VKKKKSTSSISNGLGPGSLDNKVLYYIDTPHPKVVDMISILKGEYTKQKNHINATKEEGFPDGIP